MDSINHRAYVTNGGERAVVVVDTVTNAVMQTIEGLGDVTTDVAGLAVDGASHQLLVADQKVGGGLIIIDTIDNRVVAGVPTPGSRARDVVFDTNTSKAYLANFVGGSVSVIRVEERGAHEVARVAGEDRFAVSAGASAGAFPRGTKVAYVASGLTFPDALSGSAAAGGNGPMLLVRPDSIPDAIKTELARVRPDRIVVLGGTTSVSAAVESQLIAYAPTVERIAGADRFEVSAQVSRNTFPAHPPVAYIASGERFPDALSGAAAAGAKGGPVLLVTRDSIPAAISAELARLQPAKIVVLGGPASVSEAVLTQLAATAPTDRISGADRFEVASAISADTFPANSPTAYVASGEVFSDALSGSAAALPQRAPMLLVTKDSIPPSVAAELDRLNPNRIVVLGGPNSVSDAVLEQLKDHLRK